uniref:Uncharacterized protein n=1 Tax=uncultured marine bacterium 582 TaxID=257402 RepID=Q6SEV7_9BACT|nr:hypothetical protein MBMO_EBAC080-L028H02.134 [uncultured marine bacterium 582]
MLGFSCIKIYFIFDFWIFYSSYFEAIYIYKDLCIIDGSRRF